MTINSEIFDFWRNGGEQHVVPKFKEQFPEGWDPRPFLALLSAGQKTVEYGCGYGRLAKAVAPDKFLGIDINPKAIEMAREANPEHTFEVIDFDKPTLPEAEFYYTYACFLHIEDHILPQILAKLPKKCQRFCIAEITGREWRVPGQTQPPVYCRDAQEYIDMMAVEGFQLSGKFSFPYIHYYKKFFTAPQFFERLVLQPNQVPNVLIDFLLFYRD